MILLLRLPILGERGGRWERRLAKFGYQCTVLVHHANGFADVAGDCHKGESHLMDLFKVNVHLNEIDHIDGVIDRGGSRCDPRSFLAEGRAVTGLGVGDVHEWRWRPRR